MKPNDPVARVSVVQLGSDCGDLPGQSDPPREITDLAQCDLAVPTLHPMLGTSTPGAKGIGHACRQARASATPDQVPPAPRRVASATQG
jgi:hypothetical protein